MQDKEKFPELEAMWKGSSPTAFFALLSKLAMLRYFTKEHAHQINSKIGTDPKLASLVSMGYLEQPGDHFTLTKKSFEALSYKSYELSLFQTELNAVEARHALLISDVLTKHFITLTDFLLAFYPQFSDEKLVPDACVVFRHPFFQDIRIVFVEVEDEQYAKDRRYLEGKKAKYDQLASNPELYSVWWRDKCQKLHLTMGKIEDFCFSIVCFGKQRRKWDGWRFI